MKLVVDENIPLANELFSRFGNVVKRPGRAIKNSDVCDADVLLVRSVTRVNESLLKNSTVKFVGTCTIGTDHLDKSYLDKSGIAYASAPGCNAWGVVQYDIAAMNHLRLLNPETRVGIVGCGNVGGRLYRTLMALGYTCRCYDPFLNEQQIPDLSNWEALFSCNIVCVHTPLTSEGMHPTYHMLGQEFFKSLQPNAVLLNAGRGEVIDNSALKHYLQNDNHNAIKVVLDVWENEPSIDPELAALVEIATPHIAGYSFEGKTNGSLMIFHALSDFLGIAKTSTAAVVDDVKKAAYGDVEYLGVENPGQAIMASYDIMRDDANLRNALSCLPSGFDQLRKNYPVRREFSHYKIPASLGEVALGLGFERDS